MSNHQQNTNKPNTNQPHGNNLKTTAVDPKKEAPKGDAQHSANKPAEENKNQAPKKTA